MTLRTITFDDEQWQVVPKMATPEMLDAAAGPYARRDYVEMLAAAPEPPAQQPMTDEQLADVCRRYRTYYDQLAPDAQRQMLITAHQWATAFDSGKGESDAD